MHSVGNLGPDTTEQGLVGTKPVLRVSDKVRLKPVSSANETNQKIKISLMASLEIILSKINANNKNPDQSAWMRRLVYVSVVRKPSQTVFSRRGP